MLSKKFIKDDTSYRLVANLSDVLYFYLVGRASECLKALLPDEGKLDPALAST